MTMYKVVVSQPSARNPKAALRLTWATFMLNADAVKYATETADRNLTWKVEVLSAGVSVWSMEPRHSVPVFTPRPVETMPEAR